MLLLLNGNSNQTIKVTGTMSRKTKRNWDSDLCFPWPHSFCDGLLRIKALKQQQLTEQVHFLSISHRYRPPLRYLAPFRTRTPSPTLARFRTLFQAMHLPVHPYLHPVPSMNLTNTLVSTSFSNCKRKRKIIGCVRVGGYC